MNKLARLARMGPDEIRTRAQQALSKRWARPPAFERIPFSGSPAFVDLPVTDALPQAEKICRHRFDLLGYRDLDFGTPIDWHLDPVHQKRAPRKPWHQIPFLDAHAVGDHKIIWELNRHQHLVTLAQAGRQTKDNRFTAELRSQWEHWQQENPYPIGINWASALEVAFRALSWLWVREYIGDFHDDLLRSLHLHGWYIESYLSTYFSPNTHLLGEAVALFAIGLLCPQIREASRWSQAGWKVVLQQAETQVRPDGFHFEQSVYYHIYARDFFQFARDLAAKNNIPIPAPFGRTIEKMTEVLHALSPTGHPPNFGDDDGGRVLVSFSPPVSPSPARSLALPDAGIYSISIPNSQLFLHTAFAGGHSHADSLSIQLITSGRPVLIDPGTFCYTCSERDRLRGTAAHNTLQVDRRDQAVPAGPFAWANRPETTVDLWHTGEAFHLFAAHHNGYAPVIHHRWVFGHQSGFWLVRDLVTGPGRHRLDQNWHFIDQRASAILPPAGHTWSQTVEPFDWSPIYGQKEPAFVQRFSAEVTLPAEFAVILAPASAGTFTQTGRGAYRYKQPQGSHEFFFDTAGARFLYRATTPEGSCEFSL